MNKEELKKMVDDDIVYCREMWDKYSYDPQKMGELFNSMLFKYSNEIEGINEGLYVVSTYTDIVEVADVYRKNISLIIDRLKNFRDNNYSNDGLRKLIIENSMREIEKFDSKNFMALREYIYTTEEINAREKMEIFEKLDDIEEICMSTVTADEKWDKLRPYVVWLSGKRLKIAAKIMPLLVKL